ncbi:hypothetical protein RF11_06920 [Thelohanellus kitauei]|uniref:ISXO2-like transposase domain-containing protein n=1 Tax=Thelohanellus kitauei TaxID=669202 RepID=A0A0C2N3M3_THEKT|nr:hypothetical protein RF11_06920 [Thelohanellus kitauei]
MVVPNRKKETLIPIIRERIARGSIIISDCWKAYNELSECGYIHLNVNHSHSFVARQDRFIHTQNIENIWRWVKKRFLSTTKNTEKRLSKISEHLFRIKFKGNILAVLSVQVMLIISAGEENSQGVGTVIKESTSANPVSHGVFMPINLSGSSLNVVQRGVGDGVKGGPANELDKYHERGAGFERNQKPSLDRETGMKFCGKWNHDILLGTRNTKRITGIDPMITKTEKGDLKPYDRKHGPKDRGYFSTQNGDWNFAFYRYGHTNEWPASS